MDKQFQREKRYIVIKIKDLVEQEQLARKTLGFSEPLSYGHVPAMQKVYEGRERGLRKALGKPPLECVVVESDWPEYELVWKMIEARMTGKPAGLFTSAELEEACEKSFEAGLEQGRLSAAQA